MAATSQKRPFAASSGANKKRRKDKEQTVRNFMQSLKASSKTQSSANPRPGEPTHCPICTEKYSIRHKRLVCPYSCGGEACTACHTRYLQSATTDFHCMKCRREWKLRFMRLNFSDKQLSALYKQYQTVLLARDETKLPDAQRILEADAKVLRLEAKISLLADQIETYKRRQENLRKQCRRALPRNEKDGPPIKCITSECRGYLKGGICGVCNKRYCLKCMQQVGRPVKIAKPQKQPQRRVDDSDADSDLQGEVGEQKSSLVAASAGEEGTAAASSAPAASVAIIPDDPLGLPTLSQHVCKPDDLANMEYLRANSKTCPKCGIWTSRTEGCNQMWCINCHVAWDWSTGKVVTGVIHNPHYFEWRQRTRSGVAEQNPHDMPCGGLPFRFGIHYEDHEFLNRVLRCVNEVNDYRVLRPPRERSTLDVRVKYLRQKISRETWSDVVFRRHKLFKFHEQFFHIHQMFYLAASDILQRRHRSVLDADAVKLELNNLRVYYNRELLETVRIHKGRYAKFYHLISPRWTMVTWEDQATVTEALTTEV